jgi:hypothetical protein
MQKNNDSGSTEYAFGKQNKKNLNLYLDTVPNRSQT